MERKPMSVQEALPQMIASLSHGRDCRLVVTGTSMLPFLRDKTDAVILSPVPETIRKGDILFYLRSPNVCILHRVHRILPDGTFSVCGDAQTWLEPVRRGQVIGVASSVERNGTRISCRRLSLRMMVSVWQMLRPVRPYAMAILRRLHMIP